MEKKYQVFVSSTYEDLKKARQQVMQALLELDCIPSGMELFPAADEDQWSLIKGVIDECDYYVLILGGRYGSVGPDDMGYTEKEYRYALELGKPIIAFLHKNPGSIPKDKTEKTENGQKKLDDFRALAQKKMCKFWETPEELGGVVSRGIVNLKKSHPGIGWVRGDMVPSKEASLEILDLKKEIERLNTQLDEARTQAPHGTEKLAQGDDVFQIEFECFFEWQRYNISPLGQELKETIKISMEMTWNRISYFLLPTMINEAADNQLRLILNGYLLKYAPNLSEVRKFMPDWLLRQCKIEEESFQTIIVQLRALGLIKQSDKSRSVKDASTYWTLTPYGDNVMNQLRAIHRE